jgi:NADPH2:quinone reductase
MLRLEEAPEPEVGSGEVLIRVHAVGVNFADHLMRIGAYPAGDPPIVPGLEAAGIVERVGPEVDGIAAGQRVIAWTRRSYAELAVAPAWAVCPAPANLSMEESAAIPVAFGTAWHALVSTAGLQAGEWVLAHAAGSGVGSAAIQVARALGAHVVATAGQDWKLERARELGVEHVVNYQAQEDVAAEVRGVTAGNGVDVVLEGVGRATFPASVRSLAFGGRLVIYGAPSGPRVELDTREAINRNLTLHGISITTSPSFRHTVQAFAGEVVPLFESGALRPVIDRVFFLEEAGEAHQRMMDRAQFGKLVLRVA